MTWGRHRTSYIAPVLLAVLPVGATGGCRVLDDGDRPGGDRVAWRIAYDSGQYAPTVGTDGTRIFARTGLRRLTAFDRATRRRLWDADAGEANPDPLFQVPNVLVAGGAAVFGAYRGLTAVDAATGARRWYWEPSQGGLVGHRSPTVTDGATVYAATRQPAMVYAIDLATGRERWASLVGPDRTSPHSASSPALGQGTVVVALRVEDRSANPVVERGSVVAVDAATGGERWRFAIPRAPNGSRGLYGDGFVAAEGNVAITSSSDDGRVFGLDLADGRLRWQAPGVTSHDQRPIAVTDGVVLAGSTVSPLVAYDVATGAERWRAQIDTYRTGSMDERFTAGDGTFYLTGRGAGGVFAYAAASGVLRWRYEPAARPSEQGWPFGPVTVSAGEVFAVAVDGLYALRR